MGNRVFLGPDGVDCVQATSLHSPNVHLAITIGPLCPSVLCMPQRLRRSDPGDPGVCNIFSYHGFFTDEGTHAQIDTDGRSAAIGCVDCKKILAASLEAEIGPVRERAAELRGSPQKVDEILAAGAESALAEAAATMEIVRDRVGL